MSLYPQATRLEYTSPDTNRILDRLKDVTRLHGSHT